MMAANWQELGRFLGRQGDIVTLTWAELEAIVGVIPASALNHPAWWSGDRPHARAWRAAGYHVVDRRPGVSVTFQRMAAGPLVETGPKPVKSDAASGESLLLITRAKSKSPKPAAARDLYVSSRFRKARAFAEQRGGPWFILSAEHGLVTPDEWLAPYERYLPDTPQDYRRSWGEWVGARLELLVGDLGGRIVELHAGQAYVAPLLLPLTRRGAVVERPLQGLTLGQWHAWYEKRLSVDAPAKRSSVFIGDVDEWVAKLGDQSRALTAPELRELERVALEAPGLYSWWIDVPGAVELSAGLGHEIGPGLIYVGQTGATKWPTGRRSQSTLRKRILGNHLGGRRTSSTFRLTLGSILDAARQRPVDRSELTDWMNTHLSVVAAPVDDADVIGDLERRVVQSLGPPLNLDHSQPSPLRGRLSELRRAGETVP